MEEEEKNKEHNPQSPIPNPQSPIPNFTKFTIFIILININFIIIKNN
jgi:hypothetical protein